MRMRTLKPSFWEDEVVASWPPEERLAYEWVWGACDDWGCVKTTAALIRAGAFAYHDVPMDRARAMLSVMVDTARMVPYEFGGQALYFLPSWFRHQQPSDPALPQCPPPGLETILARDFLNSYAVALLRASSTGARRGRHNAAKMRALYLALPSECRECAESVPRHNDGTSAAVAPLGDGETGRRGDGETGREQNTSPTPPPEGVAIEVKKRREKNTLPAEVASRLEGDGGLAAGITNLYNAHLASRAKALGIPLRGVSAGVPTAREKNKTFAGLVLERLDEGFTLGELGSALDGMCHDSYWSENGAPWEHALRNRTNVEKYMAKPPSRKDAGPYYPKAKDVLRMERGQ